ncbi:MAG TPA: FecR domain-containing protein [Steroidobacteraceae bacterium]|nr:FecR domain-containing protein [Steroidobacteraceae bacterium]
MLQDDPENRKRALISREAAEWFARMQDPRVSLDERRRFLRWLKQSPVHVAEYLTIAGIDSDLQRAQLSAMLGAGATSNVVELFEHDDERSAVAREAPVSRWKAVATITACGLAALLFVALRFPWHERSISTDPGEWQAVTLADGSELQLGPNTLLRVDLGAARRSIVLERGEAYFRVTKDPAHPFVVQANAFSVRAVGTEFAVAHHRREVIVTVAEGSVRVAPSSRFEGDPTASIIPLVSIAADQQLRIADTWPVTPSHVDVRYELAWRERQLMFRPGDTLAHAAEEFNSRNRVQLRVAPAAAALPVRGNFNASDPVAFAQTLVGTAPIVIARPSSDVLLIEHR